MEDDNVALQSTSAAFEDDNDQLRMITVTVSLSQDDNEDDNAELTVTVSDREDDNEDDNCAACRLIATPNQLTAERSRAVSRTHKLCAHTVQRWG